MALMDDIGLDALMLTFFSFQIRQRRPEPASSTLGGPQDPLGREIQLHHLQAGLLLPPGGGSDQGGGGALQVPGGLRPSPDPHMVVSPQCPR